MSSDLPPKEYKYKLKAEDFVKLFLATNEEFEELKKQLLGNTESNIKRENNCTQLEDTEIVGEIIIKDKTSVLCSNLECINVRIEALSIKKCNLELGYSSAELEFSDCLIGDLIFSKSKLGSLSFKDYCDIKRIDIYFGEIDSFYGFDCSIGNFLILNSIIANGFFFLNSALGHFTVSESKTEYFDFNNCSTQDIEIDKKSSISHLQINDSSTGDISLDDTTLEYISINTSSTGDFRIEKTHMNSFSALHLDCSFTILNATISQFRIHYCRIPKFLIGPNCIIEAYISGGQINDVDFRNTTLSKESLISFSKTTIYSIDIEEFSMLGNLYFRQIFKAKKEFEWTDIDKLLERLESKEPIRSKSIDQLKQQHDKRKTEYKKKSELLKKFFKESTIRISQSSLGKTEFTDCPLADFRFEFNNSKITDCFVSGGSIPTENVRIIGTEPNALKEHEQKASFFNQFKKIFEAQGDIYHATQFQAKWADEQRKLLELIHNGKKGWFNTTFSDLWILKLNKWSNLHGESWPRAFGWIMGLGLTFYLLYLFSIGRLFTANEFDFNLIGYYFEFLNPTHRINFISEGNIVNGWAIAIDVIWRIVVAYLIYQFIAAFRKHTKKQ